MPLTKIEILSGPVHHSFVAELMSNPTHGAADIFYGIVRNLNHGKQVKAVSYECHKEIAQKELGNIVAEARVKWGETIDVAILHATGRLNVGEISVAIGVTSKHRNESFEACRFIIEELKVRVPIWKQEHYLDGDSEWLKGHELCQHGARL